MGSAGQCPECTQLCAEWSDEPIFSRCDIQLGVTEGATIGAWHWWMVPQLVDGATIGAWHRCIGGKQWSYFPGRAHHRGCHRDVQLGVTEGANSHQLTLQQPPAEATTIAEATTTAEATATAEATTTAADTAEAERAATAADHRVDHPGRAATMVMDHGDGPW